MPVNGLVTMTPSSIVSTGTGNSSSINTNGSVTFSSCTALSLNGVFTSSYDNYLIVCRSVNTTVQTSLHYRFRLSGTDNTATNYVTQTLESEAGTFVAASDTATLGKLSASSSLQRDGFTAHIFGPSLAQATAIHSIAVNGDSSRPWYETASTHGTATAYDGITFISLGGSFAGLVTVYGFNQ